MLRSASEKTKENIIKYKHQEMQKKRGTIVAFSCRSVLGLKIRVFKRPQVFWDYIFVH
jgi:hypothetical protein